MFVGESNPINFLLQPSATVPLDVDDDHPRQRERAEAGSPSAVRLPEIEVAALAEFACERYGPTVPVDSHANESHLQALTDLIFEVDRHDPSRPSPPLSQASDTRYLGPITGRDVGAPPTPGSPVIDDAATVTGSPSIQQEVLHQLQAPDPQDAVRWNDTDNIMAWHSSRKLSSTLCDASLPSFI